jgi:hypothetical protein
MNADKKKRWSRWMIAVVVAAGLGGGAYAVASDCWDCIPCGCAEDGGHLLCCKPSPGGVC